MNIPQFRKQLNELNDFFNYIEHKFKDQELSAIDRDTLVDFVRDLYKVAVIQNRTNAELPFPKNTSTIAENTMPLVEEKVESTGFVFVAPEAEKVEEKVETPSFEFVAPEAEKVETPSFEFVAPEAEKVETPSFEFVAPEAEKVEEKVETSSFVFVAPEAEKVEEKVETSSFVFVAPEAEKVEETVETTSFVFEMPQTQTTTASTTNHTAFEIVDFEETSTEAITESNLVIVQQAPQSEETGISLRNSTEMAVQGNNTQPQIILNTIMDDEMFEERKAHFNPEYDDLFYIKTSNDLASKLAEKRIEDLNKAMGFNDKFLYINELFGGNAIKFKMAIDHFNNEAKSLNDARAYIERELLETFHWNSALKSNLAKDFIKLLRRRYLKI